MHHKDWLTHTKRVYHTACGTTELVTKPPPMCVGTLSVYDLACSAPLVISRVCRGVSECVSLCVRLCVRVRVSFDVFGCVCDVWVCTSARVRVCVSVRVCVYWILDFGVKCAHEVPVHQRHVLRMNHLGGA